MEIVISNEAKEKLESLNWLSIPCSDKAMESLSTANIPSDWLTKEVKDEFIK